MYQAIQQLMSGAIDIVGDVHGEIDALHALMAHLGYDSEGVHPDGRHLIFVGDLVDRGQDSPAVVEKVMAMTEAGLAQCVLGNHELNLVLGKRKEGNGWFYGHNHDLADGKFINAIDATEEQRERFASLFRQLPLALEREDVRVIHACWSEAHTEALLVAASSMEFAYAVHKTEIDEMLAREDRDAGRQRELEEWGALLHDITASPPMLANVAITDSARQTAHPLKVITSGIERPTPTPFYATGKWRMTERVAWWNDYLDEKTVVFGHYWRWPGSEEAAAARSRGPNLFEGTTPFEWLGPRHNAICVDWCSGLMWREREEGATTLIGRLGALRWPERSVVLHTGEIRRAA